MNDVLRIARLKIALQRAFLGRAILRVIEKIYPSIYQTLHETQIQNTYQQLHLE